MASEAPRQSCPLSAPIALVTGATAYIGRAIALELAYRGKGLENKEKSLAFRFRMQDTERTLSDDEADAAMAAIAAHLAASHGARLRSG